MSRTVTVIYQPQRRVRTAAIALVISFVVVVGLVADAHLRTGRHASELSARRAAVKTLGFADFALSSSARWLRHPSQVEPMAPFQDLPASFDVDPAGALQGPPQP